MREAKRRLYTMSQAPWCYSSRDLKEAIVEVLSPPPMRWHSVSGTQNLICDTVFGTFGILRVGPDFWVATLHSESIDDMKHSVQTAQFACLERYTRLIDELYSPAPRDVG